MSRVLYLIVLCFCCGKSLGYNEAWELYQQKFNFENREELVIENITAEEGSFKVEGSVSRWKSLNIGKKSIAAGLMKSGILTVEFSLDKDNNFLHSVQKLDLKTEPTDFMLMENRGRDEVNLVVALNEDNNSRLSWYKNNDGWVEFWNWELKYNVSHLNLFKINQKPFIFIIFQNGNHPSGHLYQFELLPTTTFWLQETIDLADAAHFSALNEFEQDYFLSIPQNSEAQLSVYKLTNNRFVPYTNISSYGITSVISFEIGFKSFVAFNGLNAGILQVTSSGMQRIETFNANLDGINYFIPVPVNTYRDETLLIAQRVSDHGSHKSFIVEVFTYNGRVFTVHEDVTCNFYGEIHDRLSCLTDANSTSGIIGSTYISIADKLGLIVPRHTTQNVLFTVHTKVIEHPNPMKIELEEFLKEKKRLQDLIDSLVEINETDNRIRISEEDSVEKEISMRSNQLKDLNQFEAEIAVIKEKMDKIVEHEKRTDFQTIIINGVLEVKDLKGIKSLEAKNIDKAPSQQVLDDIVNINSIKPISSKKIFENIEINNLNSPIINNNDVNNLLTTDELVLNGNVKISSKASIGEVIIESSNINGVKLEDLTSPSNVKLKNVLVEELNSEVINNLNFSTINLSHISKGILNEKEFDSVFIPGDVTIGKLNNENFEEFLGDLCLRNIKCYLPGDIKISGNVRALGDSHADFINDIKFPEEFASMKMPYWNITGSKVFEHLTARDVRTNGFVNKINTSEIITLSTDQYIPDKVLIENLEVTEQLEVEGFIVGEHIKQFVPNLPITQSKLIKSNVNFKNVTIDGSVIISNQLNSKNFSNIIRDIIYKDRPAVVKAMKQFPEGFSVRKNLGLETNTINDVHLDLIITKDQDQVLDKIDCLNGTVNFENLLITGLFDSRNISKLDQEVVKVVGQQFVESTLIFNEDFEVESLEILDELNDLTESDYMYTSGDQNIDQIYEFENLQVENIFVEGNFTGKSPKFDQIELTLQNNQDQNISGVFTVKNLTVETAKFEIINNVSKEDLFERDFKRDFQQALLTGNAEIEDLEVEGSVFIETINGINVNKSKSNMFNDEASELIFKNDVIFSSILIENLSGENFTEIVENVVYKNASDVKFTGKKIFSKPLHVEKLIETTKINSIPLDNILRKNGDQEIVSPILFNGDITFKEIDIDSKYNNFDLTDIFQTINITEGKYSIEGDLIFGRVAYIDNLIVNGSINEKFAEYLDDVVFINEDFSVEDVVFKAPVLINGNLAIVNNLNGLKLSEFKSNLVFTTKDAQIDGLVEFFEPVFIHKKLQIESDMVVNKLHTFDLEDWKNEAMFVNKGLLKGQFFFDNAVLQNSLNTKTINNIPIDSLITLKTNQTLPNLIVNQATAVNDIIVHNTVNEKLLPEEYNNTVLINNDQVISSNVIFQNPTLVRQNLQAKDINSRPANSIVTLSSNQHLSQQYTFNGKVTIIDSLDVNGLVNGINITDWNERGVKTSSSNVQNINDPWTSNSFTFAQPVSGNSSINGLDLQQIATNLEERRMLKLSLQQALQDDYSKLCLDVTYLYDKAKEQLYKFKYFEELFRYDFEREIGYVKHLKHKKFHYILISELDSCMVNLYSYKNDRLSLFKRIEMGYLIEAVPSFDEETMYLVTRSSKSNKTCSVVGTNVWKINGEVELMFTMDDQLVLQESLVPRTFYGIDKEGVNEFKINNYGIQKYRRWLINDKSKLDFVPRGLKTGLAVKSRHTLYKLERLEHLDEDDNDNDLETEIVIRGNMTEQEYFLQDGKIIVVTVGTKSFRHTLLAVAAHEDAIIQKHVDSVKIYNDINSWKLFQEIPANKPSDLVSINFGNGETLLMFLEDHSMLQVYGYEGIEGFELKRSIELHADSLFPMSIIEDDGNVQHVIAVVNSKSIRFISAVMEGNRPQSDLSCNLP